MARSFGVDICYSLNRLSKLEACTLIYLRSHGDYEIDINVARWDADRHYRVIVSLKKNGKPVEKDGKPFEIVLEDITLVTKDMAEDAGLQLGKKMVAELVQQ